MCDRCKDYHTIHSGKELSKALDYCPVRMGYLPREELLQLWLERGYFGNLIYLEYLIEEKEREEAALPSVS